MMYQIKIDQNGTIKKYLLDADDEEMAAAKLQGALKHTGQYEIKDIAAYTYQPSGRKTEKRSKKRHERDKHRIKSRKIYTGTDYMELRGCKVRIK